MDTRSKEIALAALRADFGWKYLAEHLMVRGLKPGNLTSEDVQELHQKVERLAQERFQELYGPASG